VSVEKSSLAAPSRRSINRLSANLQINLGGPAMGQGGLQELLAKKRADRAATGEVDEVAALENDVITNRPTIARKKKKVFTKPSFSATPLDGKEIISSVRTARSVDVKSVLKNKWGNDSVAALKEKLAAKKAAKAPKKELAALETQIKELQRQSEKMEANYGSVKIEIRETNALSLTVIDESEDESDDNEAEAVDAEVEHGEKGPESKEEAEPETKMTTSEARAKVQAEQKDPIDRRKTIVFEESFANVQPAAVFAQLDASMKQTKTFSNTTEKYAALVLKFAADWKKITAQESAIFRKEKQKDVMPSTRKGIKSFFQAMENIGVAQETFGMNLREHASQNMSEFVERNMKKMTDVVKTVKKTDTQHTKNVKQLVKSKAALNKELAKAITLRTNHLPIEKKENKELLQGDIVEHTPRYKKAMTGLAKALSKPVQLAEKYQAEVLDAQGNQAIYKESLMRLHKLERMRMVNTAKTVRLTGAMLTKLSKSFTTASRQLTDAGSGIDPVKDTTEFTKLRVQQDGVQAPNNPLRYTAKYKAIQLQPVTFVNIGIREEKEEGEDI
jgi:hypothetical protein